MFNMTLPEKRERMKIFCKKHGHVIRVKTFEPNSRIKNTDCLKKIICILCDLVYKYWYIYTMKSPKSNGVVTAVQFTPNYVKDSLLPEQCSIVEYYMVIYNKYFPSGDEVKLLDETYYRLRGLTVKFRDHEDSNNG